MPFTDGVAACESDRESNRDPDCEETRRELWVFYSNVRERERGVLNIFNLLFLGLS